MNRPPRTCAVCLDLEGFHEPDRRSDKPSPAALAHCNACTIHGRFDPFHDFASGLPRAFALVRPRDATGISGTGLVMQGVVFADGRVAARWVTEGNPRSTVLCGTPSPTGTPCTLRRTPRTGAWCSSRTDGSTIRSARERQAGPNDEQEHAGEA